VIFNFLSFREIFFSAVIFFEFTAHNLRALIKMLLVLFMLVAAMLTGHQTMQIVESKSSYRNINFIP